MHHNILKQASGGQGMIPWTPGLQMRCVCRHSGLIASAFALNEFRVGTVRHECLDYWTADRQFRLHHEWNYSACASGGPAGG